MKTLAQYKWAKVDGIGYYWYNVELYAVGADVMVAGEISVPVTVAKAVEFMYVVSAKKLVVDEYTIVLVQS